MDLPFNPVLLVCCHRIRVDLDRLMISSVDVMVVQEIGSLDILKGGSQNWFKLLQELMDPEDLVVGQSFP